MNSYIDGYCERLEPGFWAEPLNAVTNLAFIIAAIVVGRSLGRNGPVQAWVLVAIMTMIGTGSFLFHTFATRWAMLTDVIPIAAFVLYFLYLANRYFLGMRVIWALLATLLFFPYAPAAAYLIDALIPIAGDSSGYGAIALLIFIYAAVLWRGKPDVARGLLIGGVLLTISIGFRVADHLVCDAFPVGTHIFWHMLNACMLGWMIHVIRNELEGRYGDAGQA